MPGLNALLGLAAIVAVWRAVLWLREASDNGRTGADQCSSCKAEECTFACAVLQDNKACQTCDLGAGQVCATCSSGKAATE